MYGTNRWLPSWGGSAVKAAVCAIFGLALMPAGASAQADITPNMPSQAELDTFVKDVTWAKILGRALFWDIQVGSDGMACASCHFAAGADLRIRNQLHPNFNNVKAGPGGDTEFGANQAYVGTGIISADGTVFGDPDEGEIDNNLVGMIGDPVNGTPVEAGANYTLRPEDFPIHKLAEIFNPNGPIIITSNDRVSSSGSFDNVFDDVTRRRLKDRCKINRESIFHTSRGRPARQVEPRNTPTTINAVFNPVQFWDGRAKNTFNGFNVFGKSDNKHSEFAGIIDYDVGSRSVLEDPYLVEVSNASLASQAVGPPLSELEMSCSGREFAELGRKMLSNARLPLRLQFISRTDSMFGINGPKGHLRRAGGRGLRARYDYEALIKNAFHERWWGARGYYKKVAGSPTKVVRTNRRDEDGYTQMESNFSLFWGLAIMLYEADLISNQSRYDAVVANPLCTVNNGVQGGPGGGAVVPPSLLGLGPNGTGCIGNGPGQFTEKEADGFLLFSGPAECSRCHNAPLFADVMQLEGDTFNPRGGGGPFGLQLGFHNLGTRPVWEDVGIGGSDPYGIPLSEVRMLKRFNDNDPTVTADLFEFINPLTQPVPIAAMVVDGLMKTPSVRNTALTPPYFAYGGYATLEQVMEFYFRGGNARGTGPRATPFNGPGDNNTSGSGPDGNSLQAVLDGTAPVTGSNNGGTRALNDGRLILDADPNCEDEDPDTGEPTGDTCKGNRYAREAIVAFMKTLTDPRVQCDAAPFDHPALLIKHGHRPGGADINFVLPAAGADGYKGAQSRFCIPNSGDLFAAGMQNRVGN